MIEIRHRHTSILLYRSATAVTVRDAVCEAVAARLSLEGANLRGANLSHACLPAARLRGADLTRANLAGSYLLLARLEGADLTRAYLRSAHLARADISGANLTRTNLTRAYLRGANLRGANLSGADISGADLEGADLTRAYLRSAHLERADLSGAYPEGARAYHARTCADAGCEGCSHIHWDVDSIEIEARAKSVDLQGLPEGVRLDAAALILVYARLAKWEGSDTAPDWDRVALHEQTRLALSLLERVAFRFAADRCGRAVRLTAHLLRKNLVLCATGREVADVVYRAVGLGL